MSKEMPEWLEKILNVRQSQGRLDTPYSRGFQKCFELMSEQYETMDRMIKSMREDLDIIHTEREGNNLLKSQKLKPIETAPKNGTRVLLVGGSVCSDVAGGSERIDYVSAYWTDTDYTKDDGIWTVTEASYYATRYIEPTHWTELPDTEEI